MFDLTLTKSQLLPPLLIVAGAVDKKQMTPILANILINLSNNQLSLTATDLEMEITSYLCCDTSHLSGKTTVPAKKFIDIIRSLDDDSNLSIHFESDTAHIQSKRSQFKLATLSADDFPKGDDEPSEVEFSVSRTDLIHLLQSTHFAMSPQDVRFYLNGLLLEIEANTITAVATDGHRMAICRLQGDLSSDYQRFLLPKKSVQEMLRLLNYVSDEQVGIAAGKGHFRLNTKDYTFQSKLIEARFPPYVKAIPKNQDKVVLLARDSLKRALARIIILAHEKSRAISLHIQPSLLTLIANNSEHEEATESIEANTEGMELKIAINATYLLDVLNFLGEGLVRLSFATTSSSILVESVQDDRYQYIIMPMKL